MKWTGKAPACNKIIKINKALRATSSGLWRRVLWFLGDSFAGWAGFAGLIGCWRYGAGSLWVCW